MCYVSTKSTRPSSRNQQQQKSAVVYAPPVSRTSNNTTTTTTTTTFSNNLNNTVNSSLLLDGVNNNSFIDFTQLFNVDPFAYNFNNVDLAATSLVGNLGCLSATDSETTSNPSSPEYSSEDSANSPSAFSALPMSLVDASATASGPLSVSGLFTNIYDPADASVAPLAPSLEALGLCDAYFGADSTVGAGDVVTSMVNGFNGFNDMGAVSASPVVTSLAANPIATKLFVKTVEDDNEYEEEDDDEEQMPMTFISESVKDESSDEPKDDLVASETSSKTSSSSSRRNSRRPNSSKSPSLEKNASSIVSSATFSSTSSSTSCSDNHTVKRSRKRSAAAAELDSSVVLDEAALKRQRNTEAARRSRFRKMVKMETLEQQVKTLEDTNSKLTVKIAILESEKSSWSAKEHELVARMHQLESQLMQAHKLMMSKS